MQLREPGHDQRHEDPSVRQVGDQRAAPQFQQLRRTGPVGRHCGDGNQKAVGEQLAATQQQREEADGEPKTCQQTVRQQRIAGLVKRVTRSARRERRSVIAHRRQAPEDVTGGRHMADGRERQMGGHQGLAAAGLVDPQHPQWGVENTRLTWARALNQTPTRSQSVT